MTDPASDWSAGLEGLQRVLCRAGYGIVVAGLAVGTAMLLLRQPVASARVFMATCAVLVALPIVRTIVLLAEEVRRRDWFFAALAFVVLTLIGYGVIERLALV